MTTPARSPAPSVGRFTGLVLASVVFVCVTMIGLAGYMKYELDRAESVLAAPEAAIPADPETFGKLRRSLGYSGFVGLAQSYVTTHDAATIGTMKAELKTANEIITHLPDRTPTEVRRDLQAILSTFETVMQKADKSVSDPAVTMTMNDMMPLYAALPVLDSRITSAAAISRIGAQSAMQFWAMLLTLVCWASLIIAAAMAVGIYISLRDRNSAPLRALAQSVKNMAHGDMRTSIWGMERSDMVGELARAVDLSRYHFSQLPDMSLLSDQGPVRIRFEGNTKSMFEAMMQLITRDSEQVRSQATALATAVTSQQQAITQMSTQVESVLHNILNRGQDGNQQIKHVLEDMLGSAQSLKQAQEHAADQLNRIVPFLQERAQGLSEITHITGKQVAQVLQSLALTERGLKNSAEQSEEAIKKISSNSDDLGDRLFGAINLLQASGKILAETTETTQNRLNEAISRLSGTTIPYASPAETGASHAGDAPRLESLVTSLEASHKQLADILSEQSQATKAQIDLLTTHSNGLLAQSTSTAQTLSSAADHLREEQAKLGQTVESITTKFDAIGTQWEEQKQGTADQTHTSTGLQQSQLTDIATQIGHMAEKLNALQQSASGRSEAFDATPLLVEIKTGFETTVRNLSQMREQLTNMVINVQSQIPAPLAPADNHWEDITAQIDATRNSLTQLITQQIDRIEVRLTHTNAKPEPQTPIISPETQEQMEQQTQILTELVTTLGVLDAHMQQLKTDMLARG